MQRLSRILSAAVYVGAIVAANIVTARVAPAHVGPFVIPAGTLLVGATFLLRDVIQLAYGRRGAYALIVTALVASAVTSATEANLLAVTVASAIAFGLSESLDTEVFTRTRASLPARIVTSGIAGSIVDSVVFVVIGLSPLWSGILPWSDVPKAIVGQMLVKAALQVIVAAAIAAPRREVA